jgi:hypothetical protein
MIIELGNICKVLIECTCMLLMNENVTMWIRTWFGVCGQFTNKGETNYMGRTGVVKLIMTGDGDRETNNCQN